MREFNRNRKELLREFYDNVYPYQSMVDWLSYSNKPLSKVAACDNTYFNRREIAYIVLMDNNEDEYCTRHQCYKNVEEFKADVNKLVPLRIDIGAVFDYEPRINRNHHKEFKAEASEREYVIDIDMSDYDCIRTCCTGKKLCNRCWQFMVAAYEVLKVALEQDFGFKHIMWVFSGRRGIHAWVCDDRARLMNNQIRSCVTSYLDISVNNDRMDAFVKPIVTEKNASFPHFRRSYDILKKYFDFLLKDQKFFKIPANRERVTRIFKRHFNKDSTSEDNKPLTNQAFTRDLEKAYEIIEICDVNGDGLDFWENITQALVDLKKYFGRKIMGFTYEIIIGLLYPKIDAHVSAQTNHLLKGPFNIHSSTGLISVPLDDVAGFDITKCPSVQQLLQNKDLLIPYQKTFNKFLKKINDEKKIESTFYNQLKREKMDRSNEF